MAYWKSCDLHYVFVTLRKNEQIHDLKNRGEICMIVELNQLRIGIMD